MYKIQFRVFLLSDHITGNLSMASAEGGNPTLAA
jgi:hypothetical protein